ncbi:MAG TPA: hypothetical protein V6C86_03635 [Oculatellaceae cyanobacterium]
MSSPETSLSAVADKHPETANHKFHLELSLTDKQVKQAECAVGAALCAVTVGVIAAKTGQLAALEKALLEIESAANAGCASVLRRFGTAPRLNYYQLKNGLELSLSKNTSVAMSPTETITADMISVSHPLEGEANLLKNGTRFVIRTQASNFYDWAGNGKGIEVAFPSRELRTVWFQNDPVRTAIAKRAFSKIDDSFMTGYTKPIARWSDLYEQVSKL